MAEVNALIERMDLAYTMENLHELLTRSRDWLKRIQQIVKDLRDFARLDEGHSKEADLNQGVRSTLPIVRGEAERCRVTLVEDLQPVPAVTCDPARITEANSLLGESRKAG